MSLRPNNISIAGKRPLLYHALKVLNWIEMNCTQWIKKISHPWLLGWCSLIINSDIYQYVIFIFCCLLLLLGALNYISVAKVLYANQRNLVQNRVNLIKKSATTTPKITLYKWIITGISGKFWSWNRSWTKYIWIRKATRVHFYNLVICTFSTSSKCTYSCRISIKTKLMDARSKI